MATDPRPEVFATTHWSVVLNAGRASGAEGREALEKLCRTYWYPIYAFVRRSGCNAEDAQDLTQSFFAHMLESNWLANVAPQKGKFRSFLLTALKHSVVDEARRAKSEKRGGGQSILSLDEAEAEQRYLLEPASDSTPEKLFDQRWAIAVLASRGQRARPFRCRHRSGQRTYGLPICRGRWSRAPKSGPVPGHVSVVRRYSSRPGPVWRTCRQRASYGGAGFSCWHLFRKASTRCALAIMLWSFRKSTVIQRITSLWNASPSLPSLQSGMQDKSAWMSGYLDFTPGNDSNWNVTLDIQNSPLWPYCGKCAGIFKCPADRSTVVPSHGPFARQRVPRVRSISMDLWFGGFGGQLPGSSPPWRLYLRLGDRIDPGPAMTVLFWDGREDTINAGNFGLDMTSWPNCRT